MRSVLTLIIALGLAGCDIADRQATPGEVRDQLLKDMQCRPTKMVIVHDIQEYQGRFVRPYIVDNSYYNFTYLCKDGSTVEVQIR